jgi:hypothetical protein
MNAATSRLLKILVLVCAAVVPLGLPAEGRGKKPMHHHSSLIHIGTFGGPQGYVNSPGNAFEHARNNGRMVRNCRSTTG